MINYSELKTGDWYGTNTITLDGPHKLVNNIKRVVILEAAPITTGSQDWSIVVGFLTSMGGLAVWKSFPEEDLIAKTGESSSNEWLIEMLLKSNSRICKDWAEILAELKA